MKKTVADKLRTNARTLIALCALLSLAAAGCGKSKAQDEQFAIRTAILAHLAKQSTLNLDAFNTDVKQVTVQGDHATAQVDFNLKSGSGTMALTYQLDRKAGVWDVTDSTPTGGDFSHPAPGQGGDAPAMAPGGASHSLSDTLKSFQFGHDNGGAPTGTLPPGHPPLNSAPSQ